MDQYGSPQYGLYSGYIKPLLQREFDVNRLPQIKRTPVSERERLYGGIRRHPADVIATEEWIQENIMPAVTGSIGAFGNVKSAESIRPALDILTKFGVKHRNARIMSRNIDTMMRKVIHPDKLQADYPEKVRAATQAFQELGWAKKVIEANRGNLRVYGIF